MAAFLEQRDKSAAAFEWNFVQKFKSNRYRTFGVLRFLEPPGGPRATFFIYFFKVLLYSNKTLRQILKAIGKEFPEI